MAFIGVTIKFSRLDRQHYRSSQAPCAESKLEEVDNLHLRSLIGLCSIIISKFDWNIKSESENVMSSSMRYPDPSHMIYAGCHFCHFNDNNMGWCDYERLSLVRV